MQTKANLQDMFLLKAKRERVPVTMFLMNGFQMRGTIVGFDAFVVLLDSEGRQQVIYKHAIATIAPLHAVPTRRIRDEMPKWGVLSFQQNNRTVKHRGGVH